MKFISKQFHSEKNDTNNQINIIEIQNNTQNNNNINSQPEKLPEMSKINQLDRISQISELNKSYKHIKANKYKSSKIKQLFEEPFIPKYNPFSETLTPWNQSIKLQLSTNLLKAQTDKAIINYPHLQQNSAKKNHKQSNLTQKKFSPIDYLMGHDNLEYKDLLFQKNPQKKQINKMKINQINYLNNTCPRLKINSKQVIVSTKYSKQSSNSNKRQISFRRSSIQDKNLLKLANLTMEWDQDIVYNPEKKYFEERSLKKRILKEFPNHIKTTEISIDKINKQIKQQGKILKSQFKNNKIHRKQISVFEYKKNQNQSNENNAELKQFLTIQNLKKDKNQDIVDQYSYRSIDQSQQLNEHSFGSFRSDKWKFRTSLRTKRQNSPDKNISSESNRKKITSLIQKKTQKPQQVGQQGTLTKLTLQLRKEFKSKQQASIEIFPKTSPHFFKKNIE